MAADPVQFLHLEAYSGASIIGCPSSALRLEYFSLVLTPFTVMCIVWTLVVRENPKFELSTEQKWRENLPIGTPGSGGNSHFGKKRHSG